MRFVDSYIYNPSFWQKILAFALLPFSILYIIGSLLRRAFSTKQDFDIPIISVGNLVAGGSGKTPFIIEVARHFDKVAVISRGYKRQSSGLVVVSLWGSLQVGVEHAGDEPYLIAKSLQNASVIVCKDRIKAILKAKELGVEVIFLDDGFRFNFYKLNIILEPKLKPYYPFCLPSGIYRELPYFYKTADLLLREEIDYVREVSISNATSRMLLLTAIANPARLDRFLPSEVVGKITLSDHANFDYKDITSKLRESNATSLLVTTKDEVKLLNSPFNLSVMRLKLHINEKVIDKIKQYIKEYHAKY